MKFKIKGMTIRELCAVPVLLLGALLSIPGISLCYLALLIDGNFDKRRY
jgi:hypothetical protein